MGLLGAWLAGCAGAPAAPAGSFRGLEGAEPLVSYRLEPPGTGAHRYTDCHLYRGWVIRVSPFGDGGSDIEARPRRGRELGPEVCASKAPGWWSPTEREAPYAVFAGTAGDALVLENATESFRELVVYDLDSRSVTRRLRCAPGAAVRRGRYLECWAPAPEEAEGLCQLPPEALARGASPEAERLLQVDLRTGHIRRRGARCRPQDQPVLQKR